MFKLKFNDVEVSCETASDAAVLIQSLGVKKSVQKTVSVAKVVPTTRLRGKYKPRTMKQNPWTREEVQWIFENREQPTSFAKHNANLLKRHTPKAIGIMTYKIRTNKLEEMAGDLKSYIASLYSTTNTPRKSLLDAISN